MSLYSKILSLTSRRLPIPIHMKIFTFSPSAFTILPMCQQLKRSAASSRSTSSCAESTRPPIKIKLIPAKLDCDELYRAKNERLGRHISPSLSIYKKQMTSMLSISSRITGIALTVYTWGVALAILLLPHEIQDYVDIVDGFELTPTMLTTLKFIIALPFTYHYTNGLRSLLFETGLFLSKPQIYATGYLAMLVTLLATFFLATLTIEKESNDGDGATCTCHL